MCLRAAHAHRVMRTEIDPVSLEFKRKKRRFNSRKMVFRSGMAASATQSIQLAISMFAWNEPPPGILDKAISGTCLRQEINHYARPHTGQVSWEVSIVIADQSGLFLCAGRPATPKENSNRTIDDLRGFDPRDVRRFRNCEQPSVRATVAPSLLLLHRERSDPSCHARSERAWRSEKGSLPRCEWRTAMAGCTSQKEA
jgi:hypothetical protein